MLNFDEFSGYNVFGSITSRMDTVYLQLTSDYKRLYLCRLSDSCLVDVLGTNEKFKEAMELSVQVLKELGEPVPKKAHMGHVIVCLMRIKGLMKGKTDEDLVSVSSLLLCGWYLSHRSQFNCCLTCVTVYVSYC